MSARETFETKWNVFDDFGPRLDASFFAQTARPAKMPGMSWEAYRWTAKSPSELYQTLGPQGVDHLVRQMLDACWRESPEEGRSLASVKKIAQQVFDRNMAVWAKIKKPSPTAFFADLLPGDADAFLRQAMVMCWMMMSRSGGRKVSEVRKIVGDIYRRNIDAWDQDEKALAGPSRKRPSRKTPTRTSSKPKPKKTRGRAKK
ncbi:MAG TPA: hypothetical protein VK797_04000 [Tepidisphaeraceae bacterium]|nr:hypothetical protein [Tepidisphaeraceae bacterium]